MPRSVARHEPRNTWFLVIKFRNLCANPLLPEKPGRFAPEEKYDQDEVYPLD